MTKLQAIKAYLHRFFTTPLVADDPAPRYSSLDVEDGHTRGR